MITPADSEDNQLIFLLKVHRKSLSGVLKSHCLGHFGKVPSSAPVGESCFSQAEGRKPVD